MLFWNYSNTVYRVDGVAAACLDLQNNAGLDVNMILFCCWYGIYHGVLDTDLFGKCHGFSRTWSERTVKPIRGVRTWLKATGCPEYSFDTDTCMSYRDRIKSVELEAEKIQQITLESFCRGDGVTGRSDQEKLEAAARNLKFYLETEKVKAGTDVLGGLETIIGVDFQETDTGPFRTILAG